MNDNYLIESPADILQVIELIEKQMPLPKDISLISLLEQIMENARVIVLAGKSPFWEIWFLRMGFIALNILQDYKFDKLSFAKFLLNKHKMYTAKPLLRWDEIGILIRLDSKISRLDSLTKEPSNFGFGGEPPEDTLKDILGYCILGYLLTKRLSVGKET